MIREQIAAMAAEIVKIVSDEISIYLYGSFVLNDFQYGWSDIDILCLTEKPLPYQIAQRLVELRQELARKYNDPVFRLFEGAILSKDAFIHSHEDVVVYWGTSGERITNAHCFDCFSMMELLSDGMIVTGADCRDEMKMPVFADLKEGVISHYNTIRKYAVSTQANITSCGWLLDIARCIYTLQTGGIISKTAAGEWALENNICPVPEILSKAIEIRKEPLRYKNDASCLAWCAALGPAIQQFANNLEYEINKTAMS